MRQIEEREREGEREVGEGGSKSETDRREGERREIFCVL